MKDSLPVAQAVAAAVVAAAVSDTADTVGVPTTALLQWPLVTEHASLVKDSERAQSMPIASQAVRLRRPATCSNGDLLRHVLAYSGQTQTAAHGRRGQPVKCKCEYICH